MAAVLSARSLGLDVRRHLIEPVSVGDQLTIELEVENQTTQDFVKPRLNPLCLGSTSASADRNHSAASELPVGYYYPTHVGCLPLADGVARKQLRWDCSGAAVATMFQQRDCLSHGVTPEQLPSVDEMAKDTAQFYSQDQFSDSNRRVNAIAAPLPNRSNSSDSLAD